MLSLLSSFDFALTEHEFLRQRLFLLNMRDLGKFNGLVRSHNSLLQKFIPR